MKFEKTQLVRILGCSQATEDKWIGPINKACEKFGINTKLRLAAFIAQVGHESGRLAAVTENLNYSASGLMSTWPNRFDTFKANAAARNPERIANIVYSNRMGNGAETSGDGWKYRGRGLIQCTGKSNYDAFSQACGVNAVANPDSLAQPDNAALSAVWFWSSKGLNTYADRGDFLTITKRINGGTHGQADRELLYKRALIVLGGGVLPSDAELLKKSVEVSPDSSASGVDQKTPGAANSSIVEPRAANGGGTSQYPWNYVRESRSGHITEIDDTPGNERLNMAHRTGTYWEIDKLGTFTHKSILDSYKLTKADAYDYTGGNYTQQVKGQAFRQSTGDMIFKTGGNLFMNASRVQMNTGSLGVSGEINAPSVNADIFSGHGGLAFGDLLAKEAILAYDIKKGKAPMLGQSLGFKGGSADGKMSNNLSNAKPDGTPWITNGVKSAAGIVTAVAAVDAIADILKSNDTSPAVGNALRSASEEAAAKAAQEAAQTPVFMKHVTFDKPTLISQSTPISAPDPTIYVNNLHTIVDSNGHGVLQMSNGKDWIPIGTMKTDDPLYEGIQGDIAELEFDIGAEKVERARQILAEATLRHNALILEARDRQKSIEQGLLAEAMRRGASIIAESTIRQTAEESLSNHIMQLTASTAQGIAAAVQTEQQARTDAISAEAFHRQILAATVHGNTASITDERITRANANEAIATHINHYIASNDEALALAKTEITAKVDSNNTATAGRIDSLAVQTDTERNTFKAMVETNSKAMTTVNSSLASQVTTLLARTDQTAALIQDEKIARANATSALASQVTTLFADVAGNSGLIMDEQRVRATADKATAEQITTLDSRVQNGRYAQFDPFVSWDFNPGNEGWWAMGATAVSVSGNLVVTSQGGDPIIISPGISVNGVVYDKVRARVRRLAGNTWQGTLFYSTSSHGNDGLYHLTIASPTVEEFRDYCILEWDMRQLTSGGNDWINSVITSIRVDLGNGPNDVFEIDWISIGKRGVGVSSANFATVQQIASTAADDVGNVKAQWGIKTNVNGKVAGISLINEMINGGPAVSSFIVQADRFGIETPAGDKNPFGVDANGVYINGTVRINTNGANLATLASNASVPPLTFVGAHWGPPGNPTQNHVYLNNSDGNSYVFNGSSWVLYLQKGTNGVNGAPGANGDPGAPGANGSPGPKGDKGDAGQNGTAGLNGARGSMTFYAWGNPWNDDIANQTVANITGSWQRIIGDEVTIHTGDYAKTKYWSGTGWVDPGVRIDGNLLVTKTVSAAALNVTHLSVITPTIGTLRTRNDNSGAGVEISDNQIRVYDDYNRLRVKLGYLY